MTAQRLIQMLDPQPGERVLDIGCGMGEWTAAIASLGAEVTGLDVSAVLLEQARYRFPHLRFVTADLLEYRPEVPFDGLFSHATLHWIRPLPAAVARLYACLRSGGRLAVGLGGATPEATNLLNYEVPSAVEIDGLLRETGFEAVQIIIESGLLLITARRPA